MTRILRQSAPSFPRRSHPSPTGFSLVEILVVLLIASILLGLTYWILMANTRVTRTGMSRATIFANARAGRAILADDFTACMGPMPNPLATAYPDRDGATLATAMTLGTARGALVVVPGLRQGTLPESNGRLVNLRCDQVFFLADTNRGGGAGNPGRPPYQSVTQPTLQSTQAALWLGPVSDSDENADATTWSVGRQAVLLNDGSAGWAASTAFNGADLKPTAAGRKNSDVLNASLASVSDWILNKSLAPGVPSGLDSSLTAAFTVPVTTTPMVWSGPSGGWPAVDSDPLSDNSVTSGDVTAAQRILLKHCSEVVVQVALDRNANGLPDTTNLLPDGTSDPKNTSPWDGATLPKRDLAGDLVWLPSDQDVNDDAAGARDAKVFWPQDAEPRIVHYGYYQGPAATPQPADTTAAANSYAAGRAAGYWKNRWGDWTPYPPTTLGSLPNPAAFNLPDGSAPPTTQFGDAVVYGDYPPAVAPYRGVWGAAIPYAIGDIVTAAAPAWNSATAYVIGNSVSSGGFNYRAAAPSTNSAPSAANPNWTQFSGSPIYKAVVASTGSPPPSVNWIQLTGTAQLSQADYAQSMGRYAALHGWNPSAQNPAFFPSVAGSALAGQPPPAQSTWPSLIRIRVRLHDGAGIVRSYCDDFTTNHRNDTGDPSRAANADDPSGQEARASGLWFEYVYTLPYPRLQAPVTMPGTTP